MSALLDLALRCEAATAPDLEIDAAIADAIGQGSWYKAGDRAWKFTASIDAARTLVPEGCVWIVGLNIDRAPFASVEFDHQRTALTPALALCAAALRERAAIATEAGTAATVEQGAVHEGAGPKDIAQGPSQ